MPRFIEKCVVRHVLDMPAFSGMSTSFDTLTGSTYTLQHGQVVGGKYAPEGKDYTHIDLVDYLMGNGTVGTKLGFRNDKGLMFLTSPVVKITQTFQ